MLTKWSVPPYPTNIGGVSDGPVGCGLGFVIMFHSDDDISLFVPFFNIPMSLSSLF
jgi:hypothetical protein